MPLTPPSGESVNRDPVQTVTDVNGRFAFENLRAGRYSVSARKAGYMDMGFGQRRPGDVLQPVDVLDGQTVQRIDVSLPRGGVITGRIVDEFGEAFADVQVAAMRNVYLGGARRLSMVGRSSTTDDIGEFRLAALPPGDYYVSATYRDLSVGPAVDTNDRSGYAPTYYPGTAELSAAQRLSITTGQTITELTLPLLPIRTARVSGTAVDSRGRALSGLVYASLRNGVHVGGWDATPSQIKPDGTFVLFGVAPGEYMLQVQGGNVGDPEADYAIADVAVAGADIADVRITTVKKSTITGRITFASGNAASVKPSSIRVAVQPDLSATMLGPFPPPVAAREDWSFQSSARAGRARVALQGPSSDSWSIKTVRSSGIDVTDTGFEIRPGEDVSDLVVELTDRVTNISGLVTTDRGDGAKGYTIVAFARDHEKWSVGRYVRTARGDPSGRFRIRGLPPGDYRIIAVDSFDLNDMNDPEFLGRLESHASTFSLVEGDTKTMDLKLTVLP
jgi:hypothetical protein